MKIEILIKGIWKLKTKFEFSSNEPVFASLSALIYQHTLTPLALPIRLVLPQVFTAFFRNLVFLVTDSNTIQLLRLTWAHLEVVLNLLPALR